MAYAMPIGCRVPTRPTVKLYGRPARETYRRARRQGWSPVVAREIVISGR